MSKKQWDKADIASLCVQILNQANRLDAALRSINREEMASQRPGGGLSRSAIISYDAIKQYALFKKYLKGGDA